MKDHPHRLLNRILLCCIAFFFGVCPFLGSQEKAYHLSTNQSGSTKVYMARDSIRLLPGFSYKAQGNQTFLAGIDAGLIFPPAATYLRADGSLSPDPTQGGVVGSIPGSFALSATGGATYSIPIECPAGINGMQPSISLVYNSQGGRGLAGWGWNLSGLSAITRVQKTTYYDNEDQAIVWDASSPLALDGQRLILLHSSQDSVEYRTVHDGFNRIVGYNLQSWGPSYFRVYSPSGMYMTYGSVSSLASYAPLFEDASLDAPSGVRFERAGWQLVEVCDRDGNYMSIEYACTVGSLVGNTVKRIRYGGNKTLGSSHTLEMGFLYEQRPDAIRGYVSGKESLQQLRLTEIQTRVNGVQQSSYKLSYADAPLSRLSIVGQYLNGNPLYNPLCFEYGTQDSDPSDTDISHINQRDDTDEKVSVGYMLMDMDGDGRNEIIDISSESQQLGTTLHSSLVGDVHSSLKEWNSLPSDRFALSKTFIGDNRDLSSLNHKHDYQSFITGLQSQFGDFNGNGKVASTYAFIETGSPNALWVQIWEREQEAGDAILFDQRVGYTSKTPFLLTGNFYSNTLSNLLILFNDPESYNGSYRYRYVVVKANANGVLTIPMQGGSPVYSYLTVPKKILNVSLCSFRSLTLRDDLMIRFEDDSYSCLLNSNASYACFSGSQLVPLPFEIGPTSIFRLADMNQDGLMDVLYQQGDSLYLSTNRGDFRFQSKPLDIFCNDGGDVTTYIYSNESTRIGDTIKHEDDLVIPIDYNNDGLVDLVVGDDVFIPFTYSGNGFALKGKSYIHTRWSFYLNRGDDFELSHTLNSSKQAGLSCFGDALAHGKTDWVHFDQDDRLVITDFGYGLNKNLLTGVHHPVSGVMRIHYAPLSENSPLCDLPDEQGSILSTQDYLSEGFHPFNASQLLVVSSVEKGLGHHLYKYGTALNNWAINGFVGFRNVLDSNLVTGVTSLTYNKPLSGRLLVAERKETMSGYDLVTKVSGANGSVKTLMPINRVLSETFEYSTHEFGDLRYFIKLDAHHVENRLEHIKSSVGYAYDAFGNVLEERKTFEGESIVHLKTNHYSTHHCWCPNRLDSVVENRSSYTGDGTQTVQRLTVYTYDAQGHILSQTRDPDHVNALRTEYSNLNAYGQPRHVRVVSNGIARSSYSEYTPSGRFLLSETDPLGRVVTYDWDEQKGLLRSKVDPIGETRYTYDGLNQLVETLSPDGQRSSQGLRWADPASPSGARYYSYSQASGQPTLRVYYDSFGRELLRESVGLGDRPILVRTTYSESGQVYQVTDPYFEGQTPRVATTDSLDAFGRVLVQETLMGTHSYQYGGTHVWIDRPDGSYTVQYNWMGQKVYSEKNLFKVDYRYNVAGDLECVYPSGIDAPESVFPIRLEYDLQGNRTRIDDPDAGVVESVYDGFGQQVQSKQKVHNSSETITTLEHYHDNGLLRSIVRFNEANPNEKDSIVYVYDASNRYRLSRIYMGEEHIQSFGYDSFDRVVRLDETIQGRLFITRLTYDALGREKQHVYPSGYTTTNHYDNNGYLIQITDDQSHVIWKAEAADARGHLTKVRKGGVSTSYAYDDRGYLTGIKAANIINAHYSHDTRGNLSFRVDSIHHQREDFTYDDLNRLTHWDVTHSGVVTPHSLTYDDAGPVSFGNIIEKSDLDGHSMHYGLNGRPHALDSIAGVPSCFPSVGLSITYTDFKKVASLSEGDKTYTLTYGVDDQRRKSVYQVNGVTKQTRYYVGNYEEEVDAQGNVRKIHYLSGGDGLAAILVRSHGCDSLLYAYTDMLGSLTVLTDANGAVLENYAYDPWGKRRNPENWTQADESTTHLVNRGYTMHEHLDAYQIINMNGRVYDPFTAQFFSPDPFIQADGNWLNYNRYAYCLNNPFRYTDPSGEIIIPILIGAAIGVITNGVSNVVHDQAFFQGAGKAALIGGISGAFSFGIGQAAMGMSGFGKVAFQTLAHGHLGGVMSGINGGTYGQGFLSGAAGSLIGGGASSLLKNAGTGLQAAGTVAAGALAGGIGAEIMGGNFWDGARNGAISAGLNHAYHTVETAVLTNQLEKVYANYPTDGSKEISAQEAFRLVSPAAEKAYLDGDFTNACATRLSLAFAEAGVRIPNGYGGIKDVNGNRIIISATQMNKFMTTKYGSLMSTYSSQTSTKGIYIGVTKPGMAYSGHVTIIRSGFNSNTYSNAMQAMNFWSIR